jgi:hypothetical protein
MASAARLTKLFGLQSQIFNVISPYTFKQPIRTGNKVLRQGLMGPVALSWYAPRAPKIRTMTDLFPDANLINVANEERLQKITDKKRRGKGAPRKGKRHRFYTQGAHFKLTRKIGQGRRAALKKKK